MSLIVEDGSIVDNSNSYVSDAEFVSYANTRSIELPVDQTERESLLILAADFIDSEYRERFKGKKISPNQSMQWPRYDVYIDCYMINSNSIPADLKKAQIEAAITQNTVSLYSDEDGTNIKKEKLDVLEVEYFENGSSSSKATSAKAAGLIQPLLKSGAYNKSLKRT